MNDLKPLLSNQNHKLGKLSSFSLPQCSCDKVMSKECRKYCYANYMKRLYPSWKNKMMYNYRAAKSPNFIERICHELKEGSVYVRIHVSGDFYSQEYLEKWYKIADRNPRQVFYCYTKSISLDYSKRPKNFIVFLSDDKLRLQEHYYKFDGVATISFDKKPIEGFTLCRHQVNGTHCAYCGLCMEKGNRVYFNIH